VLSHKQITNLKKVLPNIFLYVSKSCKLCNIIYGKYFQHTYDVLNNQNNTPIMKKVKITTHIASPNILYESAEIVSMAPNFFVLTLIGMIIGFINGFWGGGGGMLCVPTLTNIVGLKEKKAHATAILVMLPLCIVSFVVYIIMGSVDGMTTLKVTIGFLTGGVIGAILLKNIRNVILNIVFAVVIIASGIKILL